MHIILCKLSIMKEILITLFLTFNNFVIGKADAHDHLNHHIEKMKIMDTNGNEIVDDYYCDGTNCNPCRQKIRDRDYVQYIIKQNTQFNPNINDDYINYINNINNINNIINKIDFNESYKHILSEPSNKN